MTAPTKPAPPPEVPAQIQQHDYQAWLIEAAAVAVTGAVVASTVNHALETAKSLWLRTFGDLLTRQRGPVFRRFTSSLAAQLLTARADYSSELLSHALEAYRTGIAQGFTEAAASPVALPVQVGLDTRSYLTAVAGDAEQHVTRAAQLVTNMPSGTWRQTEANASMARRAVSILNQAAATAVNTELNAGITAAADHVGAERVWIAERDACVHCLALSGTVVQVGQAFDMNATFGDKPLEWQPISAGGLTGPPRHPNCRCRVSPWRGHVGDGIDFPTALRREAERSILRGDARPSEPTSIRITAAVKLLDAVAAHNSRAPSGWAVPKTVRRRAERATRRGTFTAP